MRLNQFMIDCMYCMARKRGPKDRIDKPHTPGERFDVLEGLMRVTDTVLYVLAILLYDAASW